MKVGEAIIYVDEYKREHFALVTSVFNPHPASVPEGAELPKPGVNLVYVSDDESQTDTYGRQTKRSSSCVHISQNPAGANCWKDLGE